MMAMLLIGSYTQNKLDGLGHVPGERGAGVTFVEVTSSSSSSSLSSPSMAFGAARKLSIPPGQGMLVNPTYLACRDRKLYVVEETYDEEKDSGVCVFDLSESGPAAFKQRVGGLGGKAGCHLLLPSSSPSDPSALIFVSCYTGPFSLLRLGRKSDCEAPTYEHIDLNIHGRFPGKNAARQEMSHPHCSCILKKFTYVADLGSDTIYGVQTEHLVMPKDESREVFAALRLPGGSGPRHMAAHPSLGIIYILNELLSTVVVARQMLDGKLEPLGSTLSTLRKEDARAGDDTKTAAAAIRVHPTGKFLYCSNRTFAGDGVGLIALYRIRDEDGLLDFVDTFSSLGKTPRDILISPDGCTMFVANQDSGNVAILSIDIDDGRLSPLGQQFRTGSPCCLAFIPENII